MGFSQGTSADQDTRFSNKQAKLLKTQKFAPELEHLVSVLHLLTHLLVAVSFVLPAVCFDANSDLGLFFFSLLGWLQVDMTKVKMDVMKPWIATRVTELLGFEDEVLINFIYGLLEEKVRLFNILFI